VAALSLVLSNGPALSGRSLVGTAALVAAQVVIFIGLLTRRDGGLAVGTVAVLTWAGVGVFAPPFPAVDPRLPGALLSLVLTSVGFFALSGRGRIRLSLAAVGVTTVLFVVAETHAQPGRAALDTVAGHGSQVVVNAITVLLVVRMATRGAHAADTFTTRQRQTARRLYAERLVDRETRELERFVHDDLMETLRAVAMRPLPASVAAIRALCASVLSELGTLMGGRGERLTSDMANLAASLRQLAALDDLEVRLGAPQYLRAPRDVVDAVTGAVGEALRNVGRHSGSGLADVVLRRDGLGFSVEVSDGGLGFAPTAVPVTRHGVRESVVARMEDAGGSARVVSTPGSGTQVTLSWQPAAAPSIRQGALAGGAISTTLGDAALCLAPAVAWCGFMGVISADDLAVPWLGVTATLLTLAGYAFVLKAIPSGGLSRIDGSVLGIVAVLATVGNAIALSGGDLDTLHYWLAGGAGCLVALVVLLRPSREAWVPALVVCTVPVAAYASRGELWAQWPVLLSCLFSPVVTILCTFALRRFVDSFGREVFASADATARDEAAMSAVADDKDDVRERVAHITTLVNPLVGGIASGDLDPHDDAVQDQAMELEQMLRDDLTLGTAPELRRACAFARAQGWPVRLRTARNPNPRADRASASLIVPLVSACDRPASLDVSIREGTGTVSISAVITPSSPDAERAAHEVAERGDTVIHVHPDYVQLRRSVAVDPGAATRRPHIGGLHDVSR
jgi:hypothetical protein